MPLDPTKIKNIMAAKSVTRADLSRLTGIAPPNITRLLSEDPKPTLMVERLAKALGCPVEKLLTK